MTVAAGNPINSYVGNGGANSFPFTFPVFTSSQLVVTVGSTAAAPALLVLGVDYSISGLNPSGDPASTGNITLINSAQAWLSGGNLATGFTLTIVRALPIAQLTSIRNQGDFYRSSLENALDYIVMLLQDQQAQTFILTDTVTGLQYQMAIINGVLSQVPLS